MYIQSNWGFDILYSFENSQFILSNILLRQFLSIVMELLFHILCNFCYIPGAFFFDWLLLGRVTGMQFLKPPSGSGARWEQGPGSSVPC